MCREIVLGPLNMYLIALNQVGGRHVPLNERVLSQQRNVHDKQLYCQSTIKTYLLLKKILTIKF